MKCQFRDSRGQALVEMALAAPLFLAMIIGSFEIGRMAYYGIEVENAARAGASYGALNIGYATSATVKQEAKNDAPNIKNLAVSSGMACVCETLSNGTASFNPSDGTTSCASTNATISSCTEDDSTAVQSVVTYVTVNTSATVPFLFQLPGLPHNYTLTGYSALRILSN